MVVCLSLEAKLGCGPAFECKYYCSILVQVCYLCFQGEPRGARRKHEKAAGGGLEDKTEVPAGDGEKLPRTGGRPRKEGTPSSEELICCAVPKNCP